MCSLQHVTHWFLSTLGTYGSKIWMCSTPAELLTFPSAPAVFHAKTVNVVIFTPATHHNTSSYPITSESSNKIQLRSKVYIHWYRTCISWQVSLPMMSTAIVFLWWISGTHTTRSQNTFMKYGSIMNLVQVLWKCDHICWLKNIQWF